MKNEVPKGEWKITVHPAYPDEKRICGDSEEVAIVRNLTTNSEANAKLIAAAPDLLNSLTNLIADIEYNFKEIPIGAIGLRQLRIAREAIRKATE